MPGGGAVPQQVAQHLVPAMQRSGAGLHGSPAASAPVAGRQQPSLQPPQTMHGCGQLESSAGAG